MSIVKKPKSPDKIDKFIAGAPDAGAAAAAPTGKRTSVRPVIKGTRRQIALTFPPSMIDDVDAAAERFGMSRAGYINRAVRLALESDAK